MTLKRPRSRSPKQPPGPKEPVTIRAWLDGNPHAKVTRSEFMRVLDGMEVMTKQDVLKVLHDYEHARRWRRTKGVWRWIKARLFTRRSLADLTPEAREQVQQQLDRLERDDG